MEGQNCLCHSNPYALLGCNSSEYLYFARTSADFFQVYSCLYSVKLEQAKPLQFTAAAFSETYNYHLGLIKDIETENTVAYYKMRTRIYNKAV